MNTTQHTTLAAALFSEADVVHSYSRADMLADGFLVDVSSTAKQAGFRVPVAVTRAVWTDCIEWTAEDSRHQTHQDEAGRLWDVLWMCMCEAKRQRVHASFLFELYRVVRGSGKALPRAVTLKAVIGPGDSGEPVITVMQPDED